MANAEKPAGKTNQSITQRLKQHIEASRLPGDEPLAPDRLGEIAAFLGGAAEYRSPGEARIELISRSGGRRGLCLAIINDDMPFLVDSIAATLASHGLVIDLLLHPVVAARRDATGQLAGLADAADAGSIRESMIYIETARIDALRRKDLTRALEITLGDVRAAVTDWRTMTDLMKTDAARATEAEGAELLRWLADDMLTLLGHVTRHRDGHETDLLGICRQSTRAVLGDKSYDKAFAWFDGRGEHASDHAPLVIKANRVSNVHRRVPLDLFIVPVMERGNVAALSVHAGIWTSAALNTPPTLVPRMRRQFATLTQKPGFDPAGHTGKALIHALSTLPHDLLIGLRYEDIARIVTMMSGLTDRPRPRLALIEAPLGRHLFAFVWLPRDLMSMEIRSRIQDLLESGTRAETLDWSLQVEEGALALLRFVLDVRVEGEAADEAALNQRLQIMLRGWAEAVENALAETEEPARAAAIAMRYAEAFPTDYRADYGAAEAARDLARIWRLANAEEEPEGCGRDARLYRVESDGPDRLRLKIYQYNGHLPLSDAVPTLENFGFRVLAEFLTRLDSGRIGTIHDFVVSIGDDIAPAALLERAPAMEAALREVLNNRFENDAFNLLVSAVGLDVREVGWLRGMYRYLRQTGLSFTVNTVVCALSCAPDVTRALTDLFRARHDPAGESTAKTADDARDAILTGLAQVSAINDDRLLRLYHSLIEAILRTNAFAPAAADALAFKIDSAQVPGLPKPTPWREIFVYSQRVEGIHLRSAPVARGGLRWSDRRDDFRAEILGLLQAQRVKNAVIVPGGAKGGFYPKQLPDPSRDRDGWAAEGQASYEIFIRTLLSVTDNIVDDKVVHPEGVVTLDGEDPYFVVAADKGTARFSDLANAIALNEDFWLGDAFASGGSNGYDHKAMGITARGAWISVQRHFLELGIDVQEEPVRVVGCGDMSGDVFGNGMLLSKAIKLVAAFDHRHIFIDPEPDPTRAWTERKRLFDLPRSSWADYDPALISSGGGIWPRSLKRIPLSAKAREVLGIDAEELEPDALISAILAAPADLLWFGGIGTYVKGSDQNNIDVRDPSNDALRIDASRLRVRVVGEGANLGVTQAARIEFALAGGRINTDFIDNSAGVDCSDNEVNIKIALASARKANAITDEKRNTLLARMTGEVAELVLEDNRMQTLALSIAERGGAQAAAAQARLLQILEERGDLDRRTEGLADTETFRRRAAEGMGLTRPELALLLSTTKLVLQDAIEGSDLPEDPGFTPMLLTAFPALMRKDFASFIEGHRLRKEIIATGLANRIVNRIGMVHPFELAEEAGASLAQVAAAFTAAEQLFDLDSIWRRLDRAKMRENARLLLFERTASAVRGHMADLLRAGARHHRPSDLAERLQASVAALSANARSIMEPEARLRSDNMQAALVEQGAPAPEAALVVHLHDLDGAAGIADLAIDAAIDVTELGQTFTGLGARLGLDWAQASAATMNPSDPWERLLIAGLARDLQQVRIDFLRQLTCEPRHEDARQAVADWINAHRAEIRQFRETIARAQAGSPVTPAMLAHIASQARALFAG